MLWVHPEKSWAADSHACHNHTTTGNQTNEFKKLAHVCLYDYSHTSSNLESVFC